MLLDLERIGKEGSTQDKGNLEGDGNQPEEDFAEETNFK